jgi:hypothetical protein
MGKIRFSTAKGWGHCRCVIQYQAICFSGRLGVKTMKCESCGAEIASDRTVCEYCGSQVQKSAPVQTVGKVQATGNVFAAIRQSPAYRDRNAPERISKLPQPGAAQTIVPVVFGCFFTMVSLVILTGFLGVGGFIMNVAGPVGAIPMVMAIVPLGFVGLGIFLIITTMRKRSKYTTAPVMAQSAVAIAKRTAISGSKDTAVSTSLFMTFEFEDGSRVELRPVAEHLFGQIAEGDAGVLFSRADVALDFDRVRL